MRKRERGSRTWLQYRHRQFVLSKLTGCGVEAGGSRKPLLGSLARSDEKERSSDGWSGAEITHNKEQWCMSRAAEDGYLLTCWVKTLVKVYSATESIVEQQLGQTVIFGFIVMPTEDIELHSLPKKPIRAINLKCQKVAACEGWIIQFGLRKRRQIKKHVLFHNACNKSENKKRGNTEGIANKTMKRLNEHNPVHQSQ